MAKYKRIKVISTIMESGLVPVFFNKDIEVCKKVAKACADGGAKVLEFTNRGDFAHHVFYDLIRYVEKEVPGLIMGTGSILDPYTASIYINNGSNFIVGPVLNAEVAKICNRRKVAYSPGCGSASEVSDAEELGVEICKIFPGGEVGGPGFVKNLLGPMPWCSIMPTGGVDSTKESIDKWFKAGVVAVGMGSNLISKDVVEKQDWAGLTKKVTECLSLIKQAKGQSVFMGIEHVGIYATDKASGKDINDFYEKIFGLKSDAGKSGYFLSSTGPGRVEVMNGADYKNVHIAVRVSDFVLAVKVLKEKGVELEEPKGSDGIRAAFLKKTDPAGNRVHILYNPKL